MKSLSLAALFAFGVLALARADEGAYRGLVGLAQGAAADRGPNPDDAPSNPMRGTDALKDSIADTPPRAAAPRSAVPAPDPASSSPRTAAAVVLVPAPAPQRLWTRLYSTLMPSLQRAPLSLAPGNEFDAASSTSAARRTPAPLPALMPPPDSEAVTAGERRGMAELLSTTIAPAAGQ